MSKIVKLLFMTAVGFVPGATIGQTASTNPLQGLWSGEIIQTPGVKGTLTVRRGASGWHARIAGKEATAPMHSSETRIEFGKNRGAFRGRLLPDGRTLTGFWVQPATKRLLPYATPLSFAPAGKNVWRANVVPLDDKFTLYLKIFPAEDGSLVAAFRNPEDNSIGGSSQFRISRSGDALRFTASSSRGEIDRDAKLMSSPNRIRLQWPDLGRSIELVHRSPEQARSFFPRAPDAQPYAYHSPKALRDGWRTARADEVGIDEAALTRLVQSIAASDPAARRPSLIHSLLIARRGKLVLEEYFFGFDADTPHDIRSAGKTFASVLTGAEMRRGINIGPDTSVYSLLRSMGPFANPDPRKAQINLSHLMTHTTGLACNDNDDSSPGNEATMQAQTAQPNWWKYTLDLPVMHEPGTRYAYCSATMNLVGAALTTTSRTWVPALFNRDVATPLQFGRWYWDLMPNGEGYMGGGAYLLPRDLLKVGQAYLDGGAWNGRRIVTPDWVRASTSPHVEITPGTTGLSEDDFSNEYIKGVDGLAWHGVVVTSGGRSYQGYSAGGNGGQLLLVFPELDLAAVLMGGNYGQGGIWLRWPQQIVGDQIIPAIRKP
jgi:CubicO group peptidase (beta-lactamase class C family)